MLAVTIGADRRLSDPLGEGLAVHTAVVLGLDIAVAHTTGIRDLGAELGRFGTQQLVRGSMADGAIGSGAIAALGGLAMHAAVVIGLLALMALAARGLRDIGRMGILVVLHVAGGAGHVGVRTFGELGALLVVASRTGGV